MLASEIRIASEQIDITFLDCLCENLTLPANHWFKCNHFSPKRFLLILKLWVYFHVKGGQATVRRWWPGGGRGHCSSGPVAPSGGGMPPVGNAALSRYHHYGGTGARPSTSGKRGSHVTEHCTWLINRGSCHFLFKGQRQARISLYH